MSLKVQFMKRDLKKSEFRTRESALISITNLPTVNSITIILAFSNIQ